MPKHPQEENHDWADHDSISPEKIQTYNYTQSARESPYQTGFAAGYDMGYDCENYETSVSMAEALIDGYYEDDRSDVSYMNGFRKGYNSGEVDRREDVRGCVKVMLFAVLIVAVVGIFYLFGGGMF